jgi:oligopeptide transport system permease protein
MKAIPGNPFSQEQDIPKEIMQNLYAYYGLDKPLFIQYLKYLKGVCTFDLGPSLVYEGQRVTEIIREGFPISFILGVEALLIALFAGSIFGCTAAFYHKKWQSHTTFFLSTLGISMPSFLLATFLQYLFSMKLNLLPVARFNGFEHTILPALSLAALPAAYITKLIKTTMVEVLSQDYIKMAYAKGLSSSRVIIRHALMNGILPVISYLGPLSAYAITGSFIIEKIFGIPGLGQWLITSVSNRDYPLILGLTLFFSFILITMNFIVDIIYGIIDPRIRLKK